MPNLPRSHKAYVRPAFQKRSTAKIRPLTGRPWRRLREKIMQRDKYLCQICLRAERITVAVECDHKIPIEHGGTDAPDNLQALCKRCHAIKTATEAVGAQNWPDWLPVPICPVTLVSGPPAAGKTTYAKQHAKREDVIIDLDDCFTDVCGMHGHAFDRNDREIEKKYLNAAIRWRNTQLADLSRKTSGKAYVIVGAPTDAECEWWISKLKAKHIRLIPDISECMLRIDPARQSAVTRWFELRRANSWRP